jgi:cytochrome c biogenesis protein CcmG, thiol:disulfide interchange protein DsbE
MLRQAVIFLSLVCLVGLMACGEKQAPIGAAPVLKLKTYSGESFTVDGKDAQATLLVFWATWCGPCLMEMPTLVRLHAKYEDRRFRVVAINVDDVDGSKALPILNRYSVQYPVLVGSEAVMQQFGGVEALPTAFLIGSDGILRDKIRGVMAEEELERRILSLL